MGGTNSDTVCGMRFHIEGGSDVHIHDDSRKIKFICSRGTFKEELDEALDLLEEEDGMVKIDGRTKESFCVVRKDGVINAFIFDKRGIKQKLEKFVKTC